MTKIQFKWEALIASLGIGQTPYTQYELGQRSETTDTPELTGIENLESIDKERRVKKNTLSCNCCEENLCKVIFTVRVLRS